MVLKRLTRFKDLTVFDYAWEDRILPNGKTERVLKASEFLTEDNGTLVNWDGHLAISKNDSIIFLPNDKYIQVFPKDGVDKE